MENIELTIKVTLLPHRRDVDSPADPDEMDVYVSGNGLRIHKKIGSVLLRADKLWICMSNRERGVDNRDKKAYDNPEGAALDLLRLLLTT